MKSALFSLKAFLLTLIVFLPSCGGLLSGPGEPTKKYTLTALSLEDKSSTFSRPSAAHQLVIDLPTLYPPIDNTRIALKPHIQVIDYYADVEWADRLSVLIQDSLVCSFQNKNVFQRVSRSGQGLRADYSLKVDVSKFYVDQNSQTKTATVQVDYMAYLIKLPEKHIVASQRFTNTYVVPEKNMDSVVRSLNSAHLETSKAMISWVLVQVQG